MSSSPRIHSKTGQLLLALTPLLILMVLLWFNVKKVFGDDALSGSNQVILMITALFTAVLGIWNGAKPDGFFDKISTNIKDASHALFILILIGGLAGTWLISGIVPSMVYYGLDIINASFFLPASVIICAIISVITGSSWSTTATVGIALMGIGETMGISSGIIAGAVISGAYFGDKLSPLSDTTNLAPAMAGTDLFTHIKYMLYTTVPSILIALLLFSIIGFTSDSAALDIQQIDVVKALLKDRFNITPWLFLVPVGIIGLIAFRVNTLVAISLGILGGAIGAIIGQQDLLMELGSTSFPLYEVTMKSVYGDMEFLYNEALLEQLPSELSNNFASKLGSSGGMFGMMQTVWLIMSAMAFGGAMEAAGFLKTITTAIISLAKGTASLITSTLVACGVINVTASDQYLSIVVPGRMFKDVYRQRGLAPENLSRTLEDTGTVTSVLIPWNTCGAYQSSVLGVATGEYFIYAFFNLLSPLMTMIYAWFGIKIRTLEEAEQND